MYSWVCVYIDMIHKQLVHTLISLSGFYSYYTHTIAHYLRSVFGWICNTEPYSRVKQ